MRISDWSSDVCSSDLDVHQVAEPAERPVADRAGADVEDRGDGPHPTGHRIQFLQARGVERHEILPWGHAARRADYTTRRPPQRQSLKRTPVEVHDRHRRRIDALQAADVDIGRAPALRGDIFRERLYPAGPAEPVRAGGPVAGDRK